MATAVPDFIYVGTPKSGPARLFRALQEHPEVFVLSVKSSGHVEAERSGPLATYLAQSTEAGPAKAVGDISHDAYVVSNSAARIAAVFPEMKILLCLREPGGFAASVLKWWSTHSGEYGRTVAEVEPSAHFRRLVGYLGAIRQFYKHFPSGQICICFFEDVRRDPAALLSAIYGFLGVCQAHRPAVLDTVVNMAQPPRARPLTTFVHASDGFMRRLGLGRVVERAMTRPLMDKRLCGSSERWENPRITVAVARVRARMRSRLAALEALIGRPFSREWHET